MTILFRFSLAPLAFPVCHQSK